MNRQNVETNATQRQRPRRMPSYSAVGIAAVRAMERERPHNQRIVDDPFARHFVGEGLYRLLKFMHRTGLLERKGPGVVGYLVARERAIDDLLLRTVAEGIDQLVILGAGYDARAYRFARQLRGVRIFEVDLPATQAAKIEKVSHFIDEVEVDVTYVPVDLARAPLEQALHAHGFVGDMRTLFICQGILMYLPIEAIDALLQVVRTQGGPGSAILFDYLCDDFATGRVRRREVVTTNRYGRLSGERVQTGIDPDHAAEWLAERGFVQVEHVRSEELHARYFTGPNASRAVTAGYGILFGRVP